MREWRKSVPLTAEQRRRASCRAYTRVLVLRGRLTAEPCRLCKTVPAEGHHPDYGNPREVIWLCDAHHQQHHWRLRHAPQFTEV